MKKLIFIIIFLGSIAAKAGVTVNNLSCEMLKNPVGIDTWEPRFSWQFSATYFRNVNQKKYHILVASSKKLLGDNIGDLWDSKEIASSQSVLIKYKGLPLEGNKEYYWKVKVVTDYDENDWSDIASFSMALKPEQWSAQWIGLDKAFSWDDVSKFSKLSARYFRKEFSTPEKSSKELVRATAHIVGLGLYELYINGEKVGDQVLAPAPTDYNKSVLSNTFDVTEMINDGGNAIGIVLGNGRFFTMRQNYKTYKINTFGFPKLLFQLVMEYGDGSTKTVVSDGSWKATANGPILSNNEYDGEIYDARKEMPGWNERGFNSDRWIDAELVAAPAGKIKAQMNEFMRVQETVATKSIKETDSGSHVYVVDFGQNMAGWVKIRVKGTAGQKIVVRFGERLTDSGTLYTENLRDAKSTDTYILKGDARESWHPTFVYHGFRYIEVSGYKEKPNKGDFEAQVINDDFAISGSFETSDTMLNHIYENAYWGIRSNYKGMPIDCPQRNERQPWLGDRATGSYGESFIFDNVKLYEKWLDDIQESQRPDGAIPDVAPAFWNYYSDNMTWPGTYILTANMLYHQYADAEVVKKHYPSMKKWLTYMEGKYMKDGLMTKDKYGDWCVPPESKELIHSQDPKRQTDGKLIAAAYHYHLLGIMEKFAKLLGKDADAITFATTAAKEKEAFNNQFFNRTTAEYSNGSVTANLLPYYFGMIPVGKEKKVFENILDKIANENKTHISTGVIGTQWLMRGLTRNGAQATAWDIATNIDYPSWGYMVKNDATTIWELWNGNTASPKMNSGNHVMLLGDLIIWMYEDIGGIRSSDKDPGFGSIIMNPSIPDGVTYANTSYESPYGTIKSDWKVKDDNNLTWKISIPCNTTATIGVPSAVGASILEGGKDAKKAKNVKYLGWKNGRHTFLVGSGEYEFETAAK